MDSGSDVNLSWGSSVISKRGGHVSKKRLAALVIITLLIGLGIGLLIGALAIGDDDDHGHGVFLPGAPERLLQDGDEDVMTLIQEAIMAKNIEDNLRRVSSKPHIAGQQNDYDLVKLIKDRWEESGMQVQTTPYDVLLSYPSNETQNTVRLLDDNNDVLYDSITDQSNITNNKGVVPPFLAYSPSKRITGKPVFAGYGRVKDYVQLEELGVNVTNCIVIVKYGKIFRGDKVAIAASKGAAGAVLYTDPNDYTGQLMGDSRVYPETWWIPGSGVQRGTVFKGSGDPLTPGFPANNLAYRYAEDKVEPPLPKIPCHPIGYGAAIHILKHMAGDPVPSDGDWKGGLNITYRLGPGFQNSTWKLQLDVTTKNERRLAENVFGIIKGTVEPDRYVMMGNHRDAWIYGAVDPSSGTAVMLEVARVMASLVKQGKWKPRRSIMFCSWGAEEYGLIGSSEWVEQYVSTLRERVVAYVNVDIAVSGNDTLKAGGTPVLHSLMYDVTKSVKNPIASEVAAGRESVYDSWLRVLPWKDQNRDFGVPIISKPASGSDYAPLVQMAGIDSMDLTYGYDKAIYKVPSYAIYHTEYETFDIVKTQFDREFKVHQAVAKVAAEMVRRLTDSLLIPFNLTTYGQHMELYRQLLDQQYGTDLRKNINNYDALKTVIEEFSQDIKNFEDRKASMEMINPYLIRQVNDQVMQLERCFLTYQGLPTRPFKKHLIFAENANDAYAGSSFPGLADLLFEIDKDPSKWEDVKKHFATVVQAIQAAGVSLRDVTKFMIEKL